MDDTTQDNTAADEATSLAYWLASQMGEHVDNQDDETLTETVKRYVSRAWMPKTAENDGALLGVVQPPEDPERVKVLREAAALVTGDRQQDYGKPSVNFQRIADLWNVQLAALLGEGKKFSPVDVALAMTQVKMARAVQSPKRDTFVDAAGYIALASELSEGDR